MATTYKKLSYDDNPTMCDVAEKDSAGNVIKDTYVSKSDIESEASLRANADTLLQGQIDILGKSKVGLSGNETINGTKTFSSPIKTDEIDNTNGNAIARYKSTENKVVLGGSTIPTTIMGSGDRPTYSKDGSDFDGEPLALLSDVSGGGTIADGSITTAKLADRAVTTDKIADRTITSSKLKESYALVSDFLMGDYTLSRYNLKLVIYINDGTKFTLYTFFYSYNWITSLGIEHVSLDNLGVLSKLDFLSSFTVGNNTVTGQTGFDYFALNVSGEGSVNGYTIIPTYLINRNNNYFIGYYMYEPTTSSLSKGEIGITDDNIDIYLSYINKVKVNDID